MKHYVYKLTETISGEFYYGSRTFNGDIELDSYLGSMVTWKPNKDNLIKEIIKSDFSSRDEAIEYESNIISDSINNPLNRNYYIPHKGFGAKTGQIGYWRNKKRPNFKAVDTHSEETKEKIRKSLKNLYKDKDHPTKGTQISDEHKRRISEARIGTTHSDETKKKMSESASNIDRTEYKLKRKKVLHIESGVVYSSIYMAAKQLGMSRGTIRNNKDNKFKLV